ncbi:hypothetical protein [Emticicia sp. W12TSBA100-4]|jgi:hypothetical protein|uniref:hypothetical protein n=1 Tax=Emticicia sp. W12TSBA100-4 TaxID=3160965 RepID=UPI003305BD2C
MEKTAKKLGWLGITLCGLCCALPIIGAVAGISSLTAIAFYLEKIGIIALGLAGIFFAYYFYQKNQAKKACAASCETDCDCKEENTVKS